MTWVGSPNTGSSGSLASFRSTLSLLSSLLPFLPLRLLTPLRPVPLHSARCFRSLLRLFLPSNPLLLTPSEPQHFPPQLTLHFHQPPIHFLPDRFHSPPPSLSLLPLSLLPLSLSLRFPSTLPLNSHL